MTSAASPSPACSQPASGPSSSRSSAGLSDQVPPADELFAVRAQIKDLEARESELRALMLLDPSARTGNHYLAEICKITTRRPDLKEMRAMYPEQVEEHTHPVTTTRIELRGISEDGEVVSLRRKTKDTQP